MGDLKPVVDAPVFEGIQKTSPCSSFRSTVDTYALSMCRCIRACRLNCRHVRDETDEIDAYLSPGRLREPVSSEKTEAKRGEAMPRLQTSCAG